MDGIESLKYPLLRYLEQARDKGDPLGSFARTVLDGEATLQEAATFGWHGEALAAAAGKGFEELQQLTPEQRQQLDREAVRYGERLEELDDTAAEESR